MFRSTSLRLAALYTAGFALSLVVLGALTLLTTRAALTAQLDSRIGAEALALRQEYRSEGLEGVLQSVRERDRTPGGLEYGLQDPKGRALEGRLSSARAQPGWSVLRIAEREEDADSIRLYVVDLPQGFRLLVGDDLEPIENLDELLLQRFGWAFIGIILLGMAGGYGLSLGVRRRLAAISQTAEAIIDGDLSRRAPVRGSGDDLDRLALTLNRMLDRIAALMESLRQVSSDIAHDLRTPLTRLRQRLETILAQSAAGEQRESIEAALSDLDGILDTFAALLRIAQIESGARRAGFRPTDLAAVAKTVVEAFTPSAEDGGRSLRLESDQEVIVDGDRELLIQMLVNLVENALRHTQAGSRVTVRVANVGTDAVLSVIDNGPGVPEAERQRLFDRFYRLESSRSTPGSGLGLALVAAVAKLHGAMVSLEDAGPGLEARVNFPRAS